MTERNKTRLNRNRAINTHLPLSAMLVLRQSV